MRQYTDLRIKDDLEKESKKLDQSAFRLWWVKKRAEDILISGGLLQPTYREYDQYIEEESKKQVREETRSAIKEVKGSI